MYVYMNTQIAITRMNISAPKWFAERLKKAVGNRNMSSFLVAAAEEKLRREERLQALEEVYKFGPTFTQIEDSTAYVRALREEDTQRDKRLGLL
jgi:uncharacterized Fe-S cluster-containing radical SAM superfamily protein